MNDRMIRWPEFKNMTGLSRTTAWRLCQENKLPKPRQIGPNSIGWLLSEVQAYIKALPVVETRNVD
jgi:prophage regulatory protein